MTEARTDTSNWRQELMNLNEPLPYDGTTLPPRPDENLLDAPTEPEEGEIIMQRYDNSGSSSSGKTEFGSQAEMSISQQSLESFSNEPSVVPVRAQFEDTHGRLHLTNQSRWFSSSNLDRRNRNALSETDNRLVRTTSLGELNQDHQDTHNLLNGLVRFSTPPTYSSTNVS